MKGIFTWLVMGYNKYRTHGLEMPESMKPVIRQYARDNDVILQFLEDKCQRDELNLVMGKTLYDAYKTWARSNGYYICSLKKFIAEVTAHPEWYDNKGTTGGAVRFDGLTLKEV